MFTSISFPRWIPSREHSNIALKSQVFIYFEFKRLLLCIVKLLQEYFDVKPDGGSQPRAVSSKSESHSVVFDSLRPHGLCSPWNSPDKNTRVGYYSLLQGIFPIQGLNPGLLHWGQVLYHLSHQGSPTIANEMTLYYSISILLMEFFSILLFFKFWYRLCLVWCTLPIILSFL